MGDWEFGYEQFHARAPLQGYYTPCTDSGQVSDTTGACFTPGGATLNFDNCDGPANYNGMLMSCLKCAGGPDHSVSFEEGEQAYQYCGCIPS
jgi:hypothetical protein